jgi:hypothetical protein
MVTTKRLAVCMVALAALAVATAGAGADIRHDDAASQAANIGIVVALNPQPLPPRCLPPGCRGGGSGGAAKARSGSRRV